MTYIPGHKMSQWITDIQLTHDESEMKRRQYENEKREYNESEKGQLEIKVREITQKGTKARKDADEILLQGAKVLRKDIFELLQSLLVDENGEKKQLTYDEFVEKTKYFKLPFGNLKTMCDKIETPVKYTEYENLFYDLMTQLDVRFALYAPEKPLLRRDIKFNRMPEECKEDMVKHLEKLNLWPRSEFTRLYGKHFADLNTDLGV